ncbi:MAG: aminotransferase class I/II-fold pyridoxal phosphate-dependent enzyme [Desulfobacterales bacterium]|nr:aminotransferase class I/II-fold pyridoxal phosphate-dependent enzyme [Desulfobacterales bacterium]
MALDRLDQALEVELAELRAEGRAKPPERVIVGVIPPADGKGPRYRLSGSPQEFIRMNSNSYLSLSLHPDVVAAAVEAARRFGVGPGAVRFIDGTFAPHAALEERIAQFVEKPAAKIFNSAYTANLGFALAIATAATFWVGDQLNHNSIIRAMRIANVPAGRKAIYGHNDMEGLRRCLEAVPAGITRVVVIFDGVFSMRGDCSPLARIAAIAQIFKAFGVNGGFIAASPALIEAVRQKADTYIYTNPLGAADCAAALRAVELCDSAEGRHRLEHLASMVARFRRGIAALGWESIPGPTPIVPLLVRDTPRVQAVVRHLFDHGILAVGLTYPVVPQGDETVRFQVNAAHTAADIDAVLAALARFPR